MRLTGRLFNIALKTRSFYVTTPIFYVNAAPHIGHLYSAFIADTIQRFERLNDPNCSIIFSTGTDEHGTKIQQAALKNNTSLELYCNSISDQYKKLFIDAGIEFTDFIRTTEDRHKIAVEHFWNELKSKNHIYLSQYSGWYCVNDETFLTKSHIHEETRDGKKILVSSESGHPVEWTEEQNYMFRLSSFKSDIQYWLKQDGVVSPSKYRNILLNFVDENYISDISISRPSQRVFWSIQVPDDPSQGVYVWLDALINYLTIIGYPFGNKNQLSDKWPADIQVVGKDILKFHALYWPAFLMAIGLNPPRKILCHGHWTVDGQKMSKSLNNVVNPYETVHSLEALRYFLLREGTMHSDANYSEIKMSRILNSELADTIGNLFNRCTGSQLNPRREFPILHCEEFKNLTRNDHTNKLISLVESLPDVCHRHYEKFEFYKVVDKVIATLFAANEFFDFHKPWTLKNSPEKRRDLDAIIHITLESIRVSTIILSPIIPNMCSSLLDQMMIPKNSRTWHHASIVSWRDNVITELRNISSDKYVFFTKITTNDEKPTAKKAKNQ